MDADSETIGIPNDGTAGIGRLRIGLISVPGIIGTVHSLACERTRSRLKGEATGVAVGMSAVAIIVTVAAVGHGADRIIVDAVTRHANGRSIDGRFPAHAEKAMLHVRPLARVAVGK